jgi:hypothetical protein
MESLHTAMEVVDRMRNRTDYASNIAPRVGKSKAILVSQLTRDGVLLSTPFLLGYLTGMLHARHAVELHGLKDHLVQDTLAILAIALSEIILESAEPREV